MKKIKWLGQIKNSNLKEGCILLYCSSGSETRTRVSQFAFFADCFLLIGCCRYEKVLRAVRKWANIVHTGGVK